MMMKKRTYPEFDTAKYKDEFCFFCFEYIKVSHKNLFETITVIQKVSNLILLFEGFASTILALIISEVPLPYITGL